MGGSGTFDTAMVRGLLGAGAQVSLLDRSRDSLDEAAVAAAAREVLAKAEELTGGARCDILGNAAGDNRPGATVGPEATVFKVLAADLRGVSDLDLTGTLLPTLAFAKTTSTRGTDGIANVSSVAASRPPTRVVGYAAAGVGVENLTVFYASVKQHAEESWRVTPRSLRVAPNPGLLERHLRTDDSRT